MFMAATGITMVVKKVDYQKQIDDMRFMIERAFSTAYKKSHD